VRVFGLSGKSEKYRVVVIGPLILAILPQLLIHYLDKRNLAFSLTRDNVMGFLGTLFVGIWIGLSIIFTKYLWIFSYIIFFILIGAYGMLIIFNTYVEGIVFIRKKCNSCKFRNLIIDHERIHLGSNVSEEKVWEMLKKVYTAQEFDVYENGTICDYCPIPAHLIEE